MGVCTQVERGHETGGREAEATAIETSGPLP
jgi:hypothetical protein